MVSNLQQKNSDLARSVKEECESHISARNDANMLRDEVAVLQQRVEQLRGGHLPVHSDLYMINFTETVFRGS